MALPDKHPSDIKSKIYNNMGGTGLEALTGATDFIKKIEDAFKPQKEVTTFEVHEQFFKTTSKKSIDCSAFFQDFSLTTVEKIASSLKKLPTRTRPTLKMKKSCVLGHLKMKNVILSILEIIFQ